MRASSHAARMAAAALLLFLSISLAPVAGCAKADAAGPEKDLCSLLSMSRRAEISIQMDCTSVNFNVSGITYDQFSRPTSYNYSASCANGGTTYSGRVYNITWNNLGETTAADVSINGRNCHFTF